MNENNKTNENALSINNLNISFKEFALKNVSIQLKKGCIMGLIGENGAGKTTIIKSILNMYYSETAKIEVYGHDHVDDEVVVKNLIGYVAAEDYFLYSMSLDFLAKQFSAIYDNWNHALFEEYVAKWKLPLTEPFSSYSKGMKTKAMLVLALAHEPEFLLLDEPTAGLDPVAKNEILELLRDFVSDEEHAVLFSTHITTDLDKVADYITLISDGMVLESDSVDNIEENYLIVSGEKSVFDSAKSALIGATYTNGEVKALIRRSDSNLLPKDEISLKRPTIEDFMIHFIKKEAE